MATIGRLSQNMLELFARNSRELSTVEGNILSSARDKEVKTIYVTSCRPSEGKTTSAISMAYTLSNKINFKVLLVDGNLHSPMIHKLFNVGNAYGFSDLIVSDMDFGEVILKTEYENLQIITHGSTNVDSLDVMKINAFFRDKFDSLKQEFNYIIFDGCPVFGFSDAAVVARCFDGIVFVVECEKTRWEIFQQAKEKLEMAGGNILGVVLNKRKYYIPEALYGKI